MRINRLLAPTVAIIAAALVASGCSGTPVAVSGPELAVSALAARSTAASSLRHDSTLPEILPNAPVRIGGGEPTALSDIVAVGTVESVEPGAAFAIEGEDADGGTRVDWDADGALWRTAVAELAVSDAVGTELKKIRFGVTFNGSVDPDEALASTRGLGRIALVLQASTYSYDDRLHRIAHEGGLLAQVDEQGGLRFAEAVEDPAYFDEYAQGIDTVDELMTAARSDVQPVRPVAGIG